LPSPDAVDVIDFIYGPQGLVILEKNYLLVYPYDKWAGKEIPEFEEGEEIQPSVCELTEGQTSSPTYLTEADLVTLMDKNGIGSCY
jgi:DNA topoisomerase III